MSKREDLQEEPFREWLVKRVQTTSFALRPMDDEEIESNAERMGIQPDVLVEARVRAKLKLASAGRVMPVKGGIGSRSQIILCFAAEPFVAWRRHVDDWGIDGAVLLRSLIHAYLLGSWEPPQVFRHWIWNGRQTQVVRDGVHRVKVRVTRGARNALDVRARLRGTSLMGLLRALVMENMAGNFGRKGLLAIVDARGMYDDEERYYLGD